MTTNYTNIPKVSQGNSLGQESFTNYFLDPLEIDPSTLDAITGFFTARGFDLNSASSFASILIYQAKKDNVNPLSFLDIMKGYNNIQLNSLIAEIVNYNRFKTSYLGFGSIFTPNPEVARNVLP
jgi:hypothetical protein